MCRSEKKFARARARLLSALALAALLSSCTPYELKAILDGPKGGALSISPSAIVVPGTQSVSFAANGGVEPYRYALVSGSGTIDSATGLYTAPAPAGTAVVSVTDKTGRSVNATITILTVATSLAISPAAITLGIGSAMTFGAIGGTPPYTFTMSSSGSGSPAVNPGTGYYVTGAATGTDLVLLTDNVGATSTATVTVTAPAAVDYTVSSTSLPAAATAGSAIPGGQTFTLRNNGTGAGTLAVGWKLYLSSNATLDGGDTLVASGSTTALGAGASAPVPVVGTFPVVSAGPYFLIVEVTSGEDAAPLNNVSAASALTINARNIDYVVPAVNNTGATIAGGPAGGTFTVRNSGAFGGSSTVYWTAYASLDAVLDGSDYLLARGSTSALVSLATSAPINFTGYWPSTAGTWYLIVTAAAYDDVNHGNDATASAAVTTTGAAAANVDYSVPSVLNTGTTVAGKPLSGTFTYRNNGTDSGSRTVFWTAYLSTNATLEVGTDIVVDSGSVPFLAATTTSGPISFSGTWSTAGPWYLIVSVSSSEDLVPGNNTGVSALATVTPPDVNYNVVSVNNTGGTTAGDPLAGSFTFRNGGTAAGSQAVAWTAYLSLNNTLEIGTDIVIDSGSAGPLAAGAVSGLQTFAGTWPSTPGPWYLIVALSVAEDVNPGNNAGPSGVLTTTAPPVDYTVTSVINTGATVAGGPLAGTLTLRNVGTHAGTQWVPWRVYLSTNATLEIGTDTLIASGAIATPGLAAGASTAALPFTGTWPAAATPATWYYVVQVDAGDDLAPGNNVGASAAVPVTPPNVDYVVSAVANTGGIVAGGALAGQFQVHNNGTSPGSSLISWTAHYSSDGILQVTDPVIATGTTAALAGGGSSAFIPFAGTWPVTAGTWYLIVEITAVDDTNTGNNNAVSAGTAITAAVVTYTITAVPAPAGTVGGAAVNGTFTIQNTGSAAGGSLVSWAAYASLGNNTWDAGDTLIASGTTAALGVGASSSPPYAGVWPPAAGSYYIIIRATAADFSGTASGATAAPVAVTGPNVDYTVPSVTVAAVARIPNQPVNGTFTYRNTGTVNGTATQTLSWEVYASTNATIDVTDVLIASGTGLAPLAAGATSGAIPWNGFWPLSYGDYYMLVRVSCAEDITTLNNVGSSALQTNVGVYDETAAEPNDDFTALTNPVPLGATLKPGMVLKVTGSLANADRDDVMSFNTGTAARVVVTVTWSVNAPNVRIWFMDGPNNFVAGVSGLSGSMSFDWTVDAAGTMRWIDLDNYWSGTDYTPPPNPVSLTYTAWIVAE